MIIFFRISNSFFFCILLSVCVVSLSCNQKAISKISPEPDITTNQAQKILFITLEALNDSASGKIRIKITQQQVVDGYLKSGSNSNAGITTGSWSIKLLNSNSKTINTIVVNNPLIKNVEYAGENGQLGNRTIQLTRAEIPLRLNYNTTISLISVEEITGANKTKILFREKLIIAKF